MRSTVVRRRPARTGPAPRIPRFTFSWTRIESPPSPAHEAHTARRLVRGDVGLSSTLATAGPLPRAAARRAHRGPVALSVGRRFGRDRRGGPRLRPAPRHQVRRDLAGRSLALLRREGSRVAAHPTNRRPLHAGAGTV